MKERASQTQIQQPPTPSRTTWLEAWRDLLLRPSLNTTPNTCWRLFLNYNTRFEENFYIRGPHLRKHFFRPISTVSIVVCGTGGKRNRNPIVEITSFRPRFPRKFPLQSSKNNHHKLEQRTACSYSSPYLHRNSTKFHGYFGSSVNSSNNCLRSGWISAAKPHWLALPPCL